MSPKSDHAKPARAGARSATAPGEIRAGTISTAIRNEALGTLVERNYAELRAIAQREIRARKLGRTLSPTSLVAEMVVRLLDQRTQPRNVEHLCGLATILMTRAIVDRSRRRKAVKRGKGKRAARMSEAAEQDVPTDRPGGVAGPPGCRSDLVAGLQRLAVAHPVTMEIVTLRLVLELPMPRVAALLGVPLRTAYRELDKGLVLLKHDLRWWEP